ncbi:MAG: electron transfer flavoprotein subunit alpha [Deltaproteobacteria bacterium]|nr:electron transfer flavoprotein subunit alpha [Deltaproteobacteria bacterium]
MENILFLAHTESDGSLSKAALEALGAAVELCSGQKNATLTVGLIGEQIDAALTAAGGCGAARCLAVCGEDFGVSRYASDAAAAEALLGACKASLVLAPASSRFCRALPGLAQRVSGRIDTQVSALDSSSGELRVQRWFYRQRMVATLSQSQRPWILLLSSGAFSPWQGGSPALKAEQISVELPDTCKRTKVEGFQAPPADAQTIRPDAKILFVAGAGWTKKQAAPENDAKKAETLIRGFISSAKASLGSSKSLVDLSAQGQEVLSFMSHLNQVGQTGSTPRHPKGLSTCCHGEEPHVVGWRFISERRAINLDAGCGWAHGKADVLYVADAFEVMEKLNELLAKG